MKKIFILFCFLFIFSGYTFADEIYLKNGDKISGEIAEETDDAVTLYTDAMGEVTVLKSYLKDEKNNEGQMVDSEEGKGVELERKISLGYSQSGGNTNASQFSGEIFYDAKTDSDEWTGKLSSFYSSSKKKMDARKFYGMMRYAYSFGQEMKWYNFYKIEADQDRFSNIDYRFVPSVGAGYWFSDQEEFKALAELAAGYEYTKYRYTDGEGTALIIGRTFFEKQVTDSLKLSEDITFYPSLEDLESYRFSSESALEHKLSEKIFWKLSFIDSYNSKPSGSIKKNDYRVVTSLGIDF